MSIIICEYSFNKLFNKNSYYSTLFDLSRNTLHSKNYREFQCDKNVSTYDTGNDVAL